ncbi:peptide-methionine (R)-S-oxide reductase MsrB [Nanohaloarchaea archaeon]|nr:peptide-methionine (R)-S-oxide reductase MsrB [Candidatus Nanohaloarchaea archaeon]
MEYKHYITKKNISILFVFVAVLSGLAFQQKISSGVAWMTGTQDVTVNEQRFPADQQSTTQSSSLNNSSTENDLDQNSTRFWIQDSYEEEVDNLTDVEYYVTQENGTEPPFKNELYDEKRPGIYVSVVSGTPLFSSKHKFDSGTGWPSFYKPLEPDNIIERKDPGPLGNRVEIATKYSKSHLGHLFENPNTPTGLRYCMNSAALEFIPASELEERGYGMYRSMFEE